MTYCAALWVIYAFSWSKLLYALARSVRMSHRFVTSSLQIQCVCVIKPQCNSDECDQNVIYFIPKMSTLLFYTREFWGVKASVYDPVSEPLTGMNKPPSEENVLPVPPPPNPPPPLNTPSTVCLGFLWPLHFKPVCRPIRVYKTHPTHPTHPHALVLLPL